MNKGDIFIGRFVDSEGNFEYRVGRSNNIDLTIGEYGTNRNWIEAQQVSVYGNSTMFVDAGLAMNHALNLYNELEHLNNPVETIFYDSIFPYLTRQQAFEIISRQNKNDNGVIRDSK